MFIDKPSGRLSRILGVAGLTLFACRETARDSPSSAQSAAALPVPSRSERTVAAETPPVLDWCAGHALPESHCTKCNPKLIEKFRAAGDWCPEHGFPESVCPLCNPMQPPKGAEQAAIESRTVRLRAPEIEELAGIRTVAAREAPRSEAVPCTARIAFDADRMAEVRAIVPGVVRRVRVELGARVKRGAILFELESTQVGEIQGALEGAHARVLEAQANLQRTLELKANAIASLRQVEVAERELASVQAEVRAAEAALRVAGAKTSAPSGRYTLSAPIDGTVVRRPAVLGSLATESLSLATVADTSVMWALCDVAPSDASRIRVGQTMRVSIEDDSSQPIEGELSWIAAEVDPRTRTVTARAELENPQGRLRAEQFARAQILTGSSENTVAVPRSAVQRVGGREVVFVRTAKAAYEPRIVERRGGGEWVPIRGNVQVGDAVVTTGAVLLRTEILPGSIGAGCCEVDLPRDP